MAIRIRKAVMLAGLCLLLLSACSPGWKAEEMRVTPVKLFKGSERKYSPFLGRLSGSVKIHYRGDRDGMRIEADVWEDGEKTRTFEITSMSNKPANGKTDKKPNAADHELIFSAEPVIAEGADTNYDFTTVVVVKDGLSSMNEIIEGSGPYMGSGLIEHVKAFDGDPAGKTPLWGFQSTDRNAMRSVDFTPETLKRVRFAIVINAVVE
ncbi:hypothetical protein [Cohnella sp. REN36]|uniref:hypothetical protein n=1 Tax=Cohnella sp. REN36 TaxID=2887347 RepID=UPI001D141B60|nr:hypothetical protein [Cohnella sp. REN36]MCC3376135.1 hypothetical protein [Cohnella sp. REN36]